MPTPTAAAMVISTCRSIAWRACDVVRQREAIIASTMRIAITGWGLPDSTCPQAAPSPPNSVAAISQAISSTNRPNAASARSCRRADEPSSPLTR
nr:hypothetical protein [Pirellulimonas nuda]